MLILQLLPNVLLKVQGITNTVANYTIKQLPIFREIVITNITKTSRLFHIVPLSFLNPIKKWVSDQQSSTALPPPTAAPPTLKDINGNTDFNT